MSDLAFMPRDTRRRDSSAQESSYVRIQPSGGVAGPQVEFNVSAGPGFISLSESYAVLNIKTGTQLGEDATWPDAGFPHLVFPQQQLYLQGVDVSDNTPNTAHYAAYFKNCLEKSAGEMIACQQKILGAADTIAVESTPVVAAGEVIHGVVTLNTYALGTCADLEGWTFCPSAVNYAGAPDAALGENINGNVEYASRNPAASFMNRKFSANVGTEFILRPSMGIWGHRGFIPSGTDLRLVLTKHGNDNLAFKGSTAGVINWTTSTVTLYLKRYYPTASMLATFNSSILTAPLRYNIKASRISTQRIPANATSMSISNSSQGRKPDVALVMVVPTAAVTGTKDFSAFVNSNYPDTSGVMANYVSSAQVRWAGKQYPPAGPITAVAVTDMSQAYMAYLHVTSAGLFGPEGPALSKAAFLAGMGFFCFDLRRTDAIAIGDGSTDPVDDYGSLDVDLTFSAAQNVDLTAIICSISGGTITIDAARTVKRSGY